MTMTDAGFGALVAPYGGRRRRYAEGGKVDANDPYSRWLTDPESLAMGPLSSPADATSSPYYNPAYMNPDGSYKPGEEWRAASMTRSPEPSATGPLSATTTSSAIPPGMTFDEFMQWYNAQTQQPGTTTPITPTTGSSQAPSVSQANRYQVTPYSGDMTKYGQSSDMTRTMSSLPAETRNALARSLGFQGTFSQGANSADEWAIARQQDPTLQDRWADLLDRYKAGDPAAMQAAQGNMRDQGEHLFFPNIAQSGTGPLSGVDINAPYDDPSLHRGGNGDGGNGASTGTNILGTLLTAGAAYNLYKKIFPGEDDNTEDTPNKNAAEQIEETGDLNNPLPPIVPLDLPPKEIEIEGQSEVYDTQLPDGRWMNSLTGAIAPPDFTPTPRGTVEVQMPDDEGNLPETPDQTSGPLSGLDLGGGAGGVIGGIGSVIGNSGLDKIGTVNLQFPDAAGNLPPLSSAGGALDAVDTGISVGGGAVTGGGAGGGAAGAAGGAAQIPGFFEDPIGNLTGKADAFFDALNADPIGTIGNIGMNFLAGKVGSELGKSIGGDQAGANLGGTIGAIAGSFIPIPFVGTFIGSTIGSLIGSFIGAHPTTGPMSDSTMTMEDGKLVLKDTKVDPGIRNAKNEKELVPKLQSATSALGSTAYGAINSILQEIGGHLTEVPNLTIGTKFNKSNESQMYYGGTQESYLGGKPPLYFSPQQAIANTVLTALDSGKIEGADPAKLETAKQQLRDILNPKPKMNTITLDDGRTVEVPDMSGYNLPGFAEGGKVEAEEEGPLSTMGRYVSGPGGGQDDQVPAVLSDGEFVIPADVVAALGDGSSETGAEKLDDMLRSIRKHKTSAGSEHPPMAKAPLDYLGMEQSRGQQGAVMQDEPGFPSTREARKYRDLIGYGTPLDYYLTNNQTRMIDRDVRFADDETLHDAIQNARPQWDTKGAEQLAQAKLAMSRNSIGALGFDPDRLAMNPNHGFSPLGGAYFPNSDSMYATGYDPGTIVHEATHRGLQKLRDGGIAVLDGWPGSEEDLVRYIMDTRYGTERQSAPEAVRRAHEVANRDMGTTRRIIGMLESAAQEKLARQNPRGPR